jgi:hypothetical protein
MVRLEESGLLLEVTANGPGLRPPCGGWNADPQIVRPGF